MKRLKFVMVLVAVLCSLNLSAQEADALYSKLSRVSAFDNFDNSDSINGHPIFNKLIIDDFSFDINGTIYRDSAILSYIQEDTFYQLIIAEQDTCQRKIESDSSIFYYKVVEHDTIMYANLSILTFPLKNYTRIKVDSTFKSAQQWINNGKAWRDLPLHKAYQVIPDSVQNYYNISHGEIGWHPVVSMNKTVRKNLLNHKKGEVFLSLDDTNQIAYIVYLADHKKYFVRRKVVTHLQEL